jgi:GAF domain-containing protein
MASVAVDLSPVVISLLERPFDQPSLDRAYTALKGHPQAYATALRCAAKKTSDTLAAAYWFAEAARVHETMDDLGGAIALLWRALECDRNNPRPRELLAAAMVRLAMRAGLAFTFTPGAGPTPASRPTDRDAGSLETGLRPSPLENRYRDTLPDLFGAESSGGRRDESFAVAGHADREPTTGVVTRATMPSLALPIVPLGDDGDDDDLVTAGVGTALYVTSTLSITSEATPQSPTGSVGREAAVVREAAAVRDAAAATVRGADMLARAADEAAASDITNEAAALEDSDEERVDQLLPPKSDAASSESGVIELTRPLHGDLVLRSIADSPTEGPAPLNEPRLAEAPLPSEVYAEREGPPTVRPAGDRLVGGLFEALHELHFQADVRAGASFLCRTLKEKMRPATTLVHLYDINSGHFIVVSAEGSRSVALLDYPTPEDDPFIAEIMKSEESTLVMEPAADPRLARGRWLLIEPKRSVLCAPVTSDGRHLGLLELSDPVDGGIFTDDDRNALMYAASALSRFLDRRGLVLSDEPERSSPAH